MKFSEKIINDPRVNKYYDDYMNHPFTKGLEFVDSICEGIDDVEEEKLINIFLTACEYEMRFWDMSYE